MVEEKRVEENMCENKGNQNKGKIVHYEICRIISIFGIMYHHTGGRGVDIWQYTGSRWVYMLCLLGNIIGAISLPLFWMISGALLLAKEESWKKVYTKRIPRIAEALLLFSVIRYLYLYVIGYRSGSVGEFLHQFYRQEIFIPYWFLYEYLGILLVLPFLRKMMQNLTEQEKQVLFLLLLGWNILNDISKVFLASGFTVKLLFSNALTYFLIGYLLENCRMLRRNDRRLLWTGMGMAVLLTGGIYIWMRGGREAEVLGIASNGSLFMLIAISVYYIVRYISEKSKWNNKALQRFIVWCGSNVFGLYLIEDYVRNATAVICDKLGPYISALPACCIWLLAVFLIGNVLVAGMRRLPLFRKIL